MIVLVLVVLGLSLGSFVNAFVWRLHEGRNWVNERSECPHCHHVLEPRDLVPVISWLALRGKCRYCHKPIPDTPVTELVTPALFVLSYYYWPLPLHGTGLFQFVLWQLMTVLFVILAAYDLRWYILPDKVVFPVVGLSVLWTLGSAIGQHSWQPVLGGVCGVLIISGLFYLLFVLSKEKWIGFGDVKLGIALGLLAGGAVEACMVLFFASFIGVLVSAPLLLTGRASRKTQLPFGPLLLAATVVVRLFGADIINAYSRLLGM